MSRKLVGIIFVFMLLVLSGCMSDSQKDKDYIHESGSLKKRMAELKQRTGQPLKILELDVATDRPGSNPKGQEINLISLIYQDPKSPNQLNRILYDYNNQNVPALPYESRVDRSVLFEESQIDYDALLKFVNAAEERAKSEGVSELHSEELRIKVNKASGELEFSLVIKMEKRTISILGNTNGEVIKYRG